MSLIQLRKDIRRNANPLRAAVSKRFFKTGKGQYGEGDVFIGIDVPTCRTIAKIYTTLSSSDIKTLLLSKIHEERLIALLILVAQYERGSDREQTRVYKLYLSMTKRINNWDLVDLSADKIIGRHLFGHVQEKKILKTFARSSNIWERRIAIIATFWFMRHKRFNETFQIAEMLLKDKHDLIHKAVGWMLREVGKRDLSAEEAFLRKHYRSMPRTMLRYAIERFLPTVRKRYLAGTLL